MKYLGVIIVLLGALMLIVPATPIMAFETNTTLIIGGALLVVGAVVHALVQKRSMDNDGAKAK